MPEIKFQGVAANEAIKNLRSKVRIPTRRFDEILGEAHAKGFTVAGAIKAELLKDLHDDITAALEKGESLGQFRKRFAETVQRHGWSHKGSASWRTRVIYETNLRTAHMAGRWKQIEQNKQRRPYLIYMTVGDERVREDHRRWHAVALPVDDPFWSSHYPPNGWGCRCYVITASASQLERMGIKVADSPVINKTERVNTRTGEVYGDVPEGIDTGWDYNVGKAWLGSDTAFGERLAQLSTRSIKPDLRNIDTQAMTASWQSWLKQVDAAPHAKGYAHTVGYLDPPLMEALSANNIIPQSAAIIVYDNQTNHLQGNHKDESKRIPQDWLLELPMHLQNYQAVLLHKQTNNILIVMPDSINGKKGRAVVEINFKRKGKVLNSLRSLGIMEIYNLRKKEYEVIAGSLE
ncbi:MAG: phage minor head protein [Pseudomonadales bacterium]